MEKQRPISISLSLYSALLISLLAFSSVTMYVSQQVVAAKAGFLTYENPTHGIRIKYPADWKKVEEGLPSSMVVAFVLPRESDSDKYLQRLVIAINKLRVNMSVDEYSEAYINESGELYTDFKILESSASTLAGNPAHKIVFTWKEQDSDVVKKYMRLLSIKDKKAYIVAFDAEAGKYSDYLPTVEGMIDSFEIMFTDISVAMKHKKKTSLVAVKNNGDEEIFGVQMKINDGKIRFVKARGWDRDRIDQSTVIVQTSDRPIKPEKSLIILMVVDNKASSFEWTVLDTAGNMMAKGDVMPKS